MSYAAHHSDFSSFVAHKVAPKGKAFENRIGLPMPEAFVDCRARRAEATKLSLAIASRWTELRCAWMRWSAHRRLCQSIAHLDERLLADIGLDPEDLGFAERFARRRAANLQNFWSLE
jgi:uncharacterized protein YjiS (DUF1127 family)